MTTKKISVESSLFDYIDAINECETAIRRAQDNKRTIERALVQHLAETREFDLLKPNINRIRTTR